MSVPATAAVVTKKRTRRDLINGSYFSYIPTAINPAAATALMAAIVPKMPTTQKRLKAFGGTNEPRLSTFYAIDGHAYTYSGLVQSSNDALKTEAWSLLMHVYRVTRMFFDVVLLNLYRTGADYVSPHFDADALGKPVASLSFGAARVFRIFYGHPKSPTVKDDLAVNQLLTHGSCIVMHTGFQEEFLHSIPKISPTQHPHPRLNATCRQHNARLCETAQHVLQLNVIPTPTVQILLEYLFWAPDTVVGGAAKPRSR